MEGRAAAVAELVSGLFVDRGLDGADEAAEAAEGARLEEARGALRSLAQMLARFADAGLDAVCEQLGLRIAETTAPNPHPNHSLNPDPNHSLNPNLEPQLEPQP